ncbi:hypothetical protein CIW83_00085 [Tissierella sp. P1]|jgi:hypothetical protein|uniref:hypothetical protein n=1 Tax=Tissierella TaxID=41273 RepID=UPI000B9FE86B|nr:hypothetical protein [Tissierella sp. P1]MDU5083246.1 hypothetical protein [Bacillota bacterium]OZV13882.1 hypothetical protein CIW83_00085 [Tissierella sp. P1]
MTSRIKIKVVDMKSNFRLRLPSIPFWFITVLFSIALKFKDRAIINMDDLDNDAKFFLEQLDYRMLKDLIYELKSQSSFDLVDISTGDGTMVKISII